jgi:hypothetical protein
MVPRCNAASTKKDCENFETGRPGAAAGRKDRENCENFETGRGGGGRGEGETGRLRDGEILQTPLVWVVGHSDEYGDDLLVSLIEPTGVFTAQIFAAKGKFEMRLSFRSFAFGVVELADKCRRITAFAPGL